MIPPFRRAKQVNLWIWLICGHRIYYFYRIGIVIMIIIIIIIIIIVCAESEAEYSNNPFKKRQAKLLQTTD